MFDNAERRSLPTPPGENSFTSWQQYGKSRDSRVSWPRSSPGR
jgi:hypothetical protein